MYISNNGSLYLVLLSVGLLLTYTTFAYSICINQHTSVPIVLDRIVLQGLLLLTTLRVHSLEVVFDSILLFSNHVWVLSRSAQYHTIRSLLFCIVLMPLANTLVSSRLHYCNSLLIGINKGTPCTNYTWFKTHTARAITKPLNHKSYHAHIEFITLAAYAYCTRNPLLNLPSSSKGTTS